MSKKSATKGTRGPQRAREEAARRLAAEQSRARRQRTVWVSATVVVVLICAVILGIAIRQSGKPADSGFPSPKGNVSSGDSAGGIAIGKASAPVTLDLYADFMCPACHQFEQAAGKTIDQLIAQGKAKMIFHPVAFLDRYSSTKYSTRSSAASGCAADAGVFPKYVSLLYANQPPENSPGLSNDKLIELGRQAGAKSDAFPTCVKDQRYEDWAANLTERASKRGVNQTPTTYVNGKELDRSKYTAKGVQEAVTAAAKR